MRQTQTPNFSVDKAKLLAVYRQALLQGIPLEELEKKVANLAQRKQVKAHQDEAFAEHYQQRLWQGLPRFVRVVSTFFPIVLMVVGLGFAFSAIWPIVSHYLPSFSEEENLLSPISQTAAPSSNLVYAQETVKDENETASFGEKEVLSEPVISSKGLDYTDLANWFETDSQLDQSSEQEMEEYQLDIPKIKISNAQVRVGGTDLNKNLIQYPGTALPGQPGAPVIFGHSILRQFYNPAEKNPKRYSSIFSTIMTLKEGDEIYITYKNVKYTYKVVSHTEVKPSDVFILAQRYDARQLKLVTCVPEGTTLRRGVVTAELVK